MNIKIIAASAGLGLSLLLSASGAASAANLLSNGGFENDDAVSTAYPYYNIGPDLHSDPQGGADFAVPSDFGWTVSNGNVDIITYTTYGPAPANGGLSGLDLVGYGSTGEISQTINTVAGQSYDVSFVFENNPGFADPTAAVVVNFGSIGTVTGVGGLGGWQTYTNTFQATGPTTTFSLNETLGGSNGGVFLDNISITSAVPEPATWALMLLGFGAIGWTLRGSRGKQAAATA
jgi:hypothetical protein